MSATVLGMQHMQLVKRIVPWLSLLIGSGTLAMHVVVFYFLPYGILLMAESEFLSAKISLSVNKPLSIDPYSFFLCSQAV